ncbi:hypothetical protein [Microbacterium sp. No. 7]|uniref:hypothetical protein n=1 Tax=Microbacterium sp. No. 7 TaxID=1714373 RepID=UPI0006D28171|nr:hypothetical protein [Microbacterium sp. No. 7]ALJ18717.1 hypothetical protein AOA12_01835 [Microbacterium sp. No. 7]
MSDLEIRSGGVIAVDVGSLRAAAAALAGIAAAVDRAAEPLRGAAPLLRAAGAGHHRPDEDAEQASAAAARIVHDLTEMADLYELVERVAADDFASRADRLEAASLVARWRNERETEFLRQTGGVALLFTPIGAMLSSVMAAVHGADRGRLPAGTLLADVDGEVRTTLRSSARTTAPATLEQIVDRIPHGDGAPLRIERYELPGGGVEFAVYVQGTRALGGGEPFDLGSNLDLYVDREAGASYVALRQALHQAGAEPGAVLHVAGHSQGAMDVAFLALSGDYDVRTIVTAGSPVEADVGGDTLSVTMRHTDDPVAYLANGGFATGVGAAGSFVAERRIGGANPVTSHLLPNYRETASMLDRSDDPRMDAVRDRLAGLGTAASVTVFTYDAERVARGRSGGGGF